MWVGLWTEIEAPTRCEDVTQQLSCLGTELLLLAFALSLRLCFFAGTFTFGLDALGFLLQASRTVGGDAMKERGLRSSWVPGGCWECSRFTTKGGP
ncbi:MAG: hypothetical protein ACRDQA_00685 [Nocardioidaceae bacterium]